MFPAHIVDVLPKTHATFITTCPLAFMVPCSIGRKCWTTSFSASETQGLNGNLRSQRCSRFRTLPRDLCSKRHRSVSSAFSKDRWTRNNSSSTKSCQVSPITGNYRPFPRCLCLFQGGSIGLKFNIMDLCFSNQTLMNSCKLIRFCTSQGWNHSSLQNTKTSNILML